MNIEKVVIDGKPHAKLPSGATLTGAVYLEAKQEISKVLIEQGYVNLNSTEGQEQAKEKLISSGVVVSVDNIPVIEESPMPSLTNGDGLSFMEHAQKEVDEYSKMEPGTGGGVIFSSQHCQLMEGLNGSGKNGTKVSTTSEVADLQDLVQSACRTTDGLNDKVLGVTIIILAKIKPEESPL